MAKAKSEPVSMPQSLIDAAKNILEAKRAFRDESAKFFYNSPEMTPKRFWEIMEEYRSLVIGAIRSKDRNNESKQAASELMRRAWKGSQVGHAANTFKPNSLHEMTAFTRRYGELTDAIATALDNGKMKLDRTDDPFSDLCDSLPLAGKAVCDKILAGKYMLVAVLEAEVTKAAYAATEKVAGGLPDDVEPLCTFILEGENYNDMALRTALKEAIMLACVADACKPGDDPISDDDE